MGFGASLNFSQYTFRRFLRVFENYFENGKLVLASVYATFPKLLELHERGFLGAEICNSPTCNFKYSRTPQTGDKEAGSNKNKILLFCLLRMNHTCEEINLFL